MSNRCLCSHPFEDHGPAGICCRAGCDCLDFREAMGDVPASLLSTLGENLMRARLSAGLSREQTGLEPSLLSKYERGLIVPGLMNLVWLCEKYDVAIDDIIDVAAWVDAARETRG